MLDARSVGSNLTPAQQDETMRDLVFFLDVYGSTRAVRVELQEQESFIQHLERQVRRLLVSMGGRETIRQQDEEKHPRKGESDRRDNKEENNVDEMMVDLDFFLKTYGSTKAVRDKLQRQQKEITGLQLTIQWLKERQKATEKENNRYQGFRVEKLDRVQSQVAKVMLESPEFGTKQHTNEETNALLGLQCETTSIDRIDVDGLRMQHAVGDSAGTMNGGASENSLLGQSEGFSEVPSEHSSDNIATEDKSVAETTLKRKSKKLCDIPECSKVAQVNGLCCGHGGFHMCKVVGCTMKAATRHLCRLHGGGTRCKITGCEKLCVSGGQGHCTRHARDHGIKVGKACQIQECKKLAVYSGGGYCCTHAREQGITVKSGKKCILADCKKYAVPSGEGYCCKHAREHGIAAKWGKKCVTSDCVNFAISSGKGYCWSHAREHGIEPKESKKCCVSDCVKFAASKGEGYCYRHAREHGIVVNVGKKCVISDCAKLAFSSGKGYCCRHAREHGIEVKVGKKCCLSECEKFAVSSCKGHCWRHARDQGIEPKRRCKHAECHRVRVMKGYCHDHVGDGSLSHFQFDRYEKVSTLADLPQSTDHDDSFSNKLSGNSISNNSTIKRRGSHAVCKARGCLKWVMRNGDLNVYCVNHRGDDHEDADKTVLQKVPCRKGCKEPGCDKMGIDGGHKKGYCFRHGGGYPCIVEGCAKARQRNRYCYTHFREGLTLK